MRHLSCCLSMLSVIFSATCAMAHFGMVIPSASTVMQKSDARITLDIAFVHPFSNTGMDMEKPADFAIFANSQKTEAASSLKPVKFMDHDAWQTVYEIKKPGVYQFAAIPKPYFEAAEDCFIIHYAKTMVAAFGAEDGWDEPLGLPVEIVPLSRPFGNYAGNMFQGIALKDGKPLEYALVEIECLNRDGKHIAPNAYFETQTVKTDKNGIFSFSIPWAGWWGFAALTESDDKIDFKGESKNVELGGVLWVEFVEPMLKK